MSTSPSKPLTPQMQGEVDSIVFKQKRGSPKTGLSPHTTPQPERSAGQGGVVSVSPLRMPSFSPPSDAPVSEASPSNLASRRPYKSPYLVEAPGPELVYVLGGRRYADKDMEDHVLPGQLSFDSGPNKMPFDQVYSSKFNREDTRDHFGYGMNMHEDNSTMNAYDRVYDSRFVEKDTEDHFTGMTLGRDMDAIALEEKAAERLKLYNEAKDAYKIGFPEKAHMGHEQLDGANHFEDYTMNLNADADEGNSFDRVYDSRFDHKDTEDHFDGYSMKLAASADAGNTFDRVFGSVFDERHAVSHFDSGSMAMGPPGLTEQQITHYYPTLTKEEMVPPPRPKFLRGMPGTGSNAQREHPALLAMEEARKNKMLSKKMQAEVDALNFKLPLVLRQQDTAVRRRRYPLRARFATPKAKYSDGGGSGSGGGGGAAAAAAAAPTRTLSHP